MKVKVWKCESESVKVWKCESKSVKVKVWKWKCEILKVKVWKWPKWPTENVVFDKLIKSNIDCIQPQKPEKYEFYSVLVCFFRCNSISLHLPQSVSGSVIHSFSLEIYTNQKVRKSVTNKITLFLLICCFSKISATNQ